MQFEKIINNCPVSSLIIDHNGIVQGVNTLALELLCLTEKQIIGKPFANLVYKDDLISFFKHRQTVMSQKKADQSILRLTPGNGASLSIKTHSQKIASESGRLPFIWMVIEKSTPPKPTQENQDPDLKFITSLAHSLSLNDENEAKDLIGIIRKALESLGYYIGADRVYLLALNETNESIVDAIEWCHSGIIPRWDQFDRMTAPTAPWFFKNWNATTPINLSDLTRMPEEAANEKQKLTEYGCSSILQIVLQGIGGTKRILGLDLVQSKIKWRKRHAAILHITGTMIQNLYEIVDPFSPLLLLEHKENEMTAELQPSPPPSFELTGNGELFNEFLQPPINPYHEIDKKCIRILHDETDLPPYWELQKGIHSVLSRKQKIKLDQSGQVSITCPECQKEKKMPVSIFMNADYTIKVTCPCKKDFIVELELRAHPRKKILLVGVYSMEGASGNWIQIQILNLSKSGIGFKVTGGAHDIKVGDQFKIRFALDDLTRSVIIKDAVAKQIKDTYIGCKFLQSERYDRILNQYFSGKK